MSTMSICTIGSILRDRFRVLDLIYQGNGKCIYNVEDVTNNQAYIMKVTGKFITFRNEYSFLSKNQNLEGFPNLISTFNDQGRYYCLVMTHVGIPIARHLERRNFLFSMQNTIRFGFRVFGIVEKMHERGYLHKDLNCNNIMVQRGSDGNLQLNLIDFEATIKIDPPVQCVNWYAWCQSPNVFKNGYYTMFDDYESILFNMMLTQRIDPFGQDNSNYKRTKEEFHSNPMAFFVHPSTRWMGKLYLELETQRDTGYSKKKIEDIFNGAVENFDPKSNITYQIHENIAYIE